MTDWIEGRLTFLMGGEAPMWHALTGTRPFEALCGRQLPPPERLHLAALVPGGVRITCTRCIGYLLPTFNMPDTEPERGRHTPPLQEGV